MFIKLVCKELYKQVLCWIYNESWIIPALYKFSVFCRIIYMCIVILYESCKTVWIWRQYHHMSNREIIEEIYSLYEQKMYYIAFSVLKDELAAEDAVQDAFEKMIKNISRLKNVDNDKTKAYIFKTIKNTSIDIYRKRKREYERMEKNVTEAFLDISVYDSNTKISEQEIIDKINELPDKYGEVIFLRLIKGIPIKEIALKKGLSFDATRKRYERGIKMLRESKDW